MAEQPNNIPTPSRPRPALDAVAAVHLVKIRDAMRGQGFAISHQTVANIVQRHQLAAEAAQ